jgi:two-component system chemotaxis response regulator CheY
MHYCFSYTADERGLTMTEERKPLLLIVDDSRTSRMLIKGIIASLRPDWRTVEADSGDAALVQLGVELPDFVSMDVNMPGMSGLEAAGRIRIKHPEVRIVLCTANVQESVREAARKAGMDFVAKPITPASVTAMVSFFETTEGQSGAAQP